VGGGGFTADVGAIKGEAQQFLQEAQAMAQLVGSLGGAGMARTGDGGLDGLIAGRLGDVEASVGGAGMAMEADGLGLLGNAANYEKADHMSVVNRSGP
jgi:hypothetical protein